MKLACTECGHLLIILDFNTEGTHNVKLEVFCPWCETKWPIEIDLWDSSGVDPPGQYL